MLHISDSVVPYLSRAINGIGIGKLDGQAYREMVALSRSVSVEADRLAGRESLDVFERTIAGLEALLDRLKAEVEGVRPFDHNERPIWELCDDVLKGVPDALQQLPTDGAAQHDYYIYGTPKTETDCGGAK